MRLFTLPDVRRKTLAKNLHPFKQCTRADLFRKLCEADEHGTGDTEFLTHLANYFGGDF